MPATHAHNTGTLYYITFSFNYTFQPFGNWWYKLLQFCKWKLQNCWTQDFCCSTVCGCHCLIFLSMIYIFNRRQVQAGQSSMHTLWRHTLVACTDWGLVLSTWTIHWLCGKSHCLDGRICLFQYVSPHQWYLHMQVVPAASNDASLHRYWLLHFSVITVHFF